MSMDEREEILAEIEAVKAVYGDDCTILNDYPPHLHVHIKPRTAEISSQQFVEAVLTVQGGLHYPKEPPCIDLIRCKGLDDQRQKHIKTTICEKASELSSCLMLVALIEEAAERLSIMNHPEGDCPLCLYPLVPETDQVVVPFMKLMSCYHCFHSECIIRWWGWLQNENGEKSNLANATAQSYRDRKNVSGIDGMMEGKTGLCPVCREVFLDKDLEHVQDFVYTQPPQKGPNVVEAVEEEELIECDSENIRRQKFEEIFRLQKENCGVIEPRKELLVLPGMFLPQPSTSVSTSSTEATVEQQETVPPLISPKTSSGPSTKFGTSKHRNARRRTHGAEKSSSSMFLPQSSTSVNTSSTEATIEQQETAPPLVSLKTSSDSSTKTGTNKHRNARTRTYGPQKISSGMFRPQLSTSVNISSTEATVEQQETVPPLVSRKSSSDSSTKAGTSKHRNARTGAHGSQNSRKPIGQWIVKEDA